MIAPATSRIESKAAPLTPLQWLICAIAALGFAFDSYVLLMVPLVIPPALVELLGVPPTNPAVNDWVGILFYVPAVAGGIFGLLGGYLTDLLGRRRVLVWSILLYAFSTLAAGFTTSVQWLLVWRCCTFVGVCVEFVAAVAWLAELFPDPKQREAVIGYTQACGSLGGVMVTGAYYLVVTYGGSPPRGSRRTRSVALYADVRRDSGNPADPDQAFSPRVSDVARQESRRHIEAPRDRRAFPPAIPDHDAGHDGDDGVRIRGRLWCDSTDAADRARSA